VFRKEQARRGKRAAGSGSASRPTSRSAASRPSAWIGAGGQGWGARPLGERERSRPSHGQGVVTTGTQSQGQGHETTILAGRRGRSSVSRRGRDRRARRHAQHAVRLRHVREPAAQPSAEPPSTRACRRSRTRRSASPRTCSRRTPTTSSTRTARRSSRGAPDNAKTIQEIAGAAALAYDLPEGEEPFLDDITVLRPAELHVPVRHAYRGGRGDGETGEVRLLRYIAVGRRRQGHQPDDRRRPGARRDRAGHRAGALGRRRLRRERPAADGEHDGLRRPEGGVLPAVPGRAHGDPDRHQSRSA
jgi:carbon-monoxide dehydrogenase large subunit